MTENKVSTERILKVCASFPAEVREKIEEAMDSASQLGGAVFDFVNKSGTIILSGICPRFTVRATIIAEHNVGLLGWDTKLDLIMPKHRYVFLYYEGTWIRSEEYLEERQLKFPVSVDKAFELLMSE